MSKLEELLQGVDVEWLPLGACAVYEQPNKYLVKSKDYNNEYNTPVLTAGKTFILGYTNEKEGIYKASLAPVIIFDDFTTANKWVDFDFKAKSSAMKIIKSKDESKTLLRYIYYWINSLPSDLVEGDHKRQWISNFSKKLIPIPSIEIQQEIVRVLDELTSLTNQLTTELETERQNRKKQFEFFREQMFRFEEGKAEWKSLKDVAEYSKKRINFTFLNESNYVGVDNLLQNRGGKINSKHIPTEGNSTAFLTNNILIGNIRPYLKKIWLADCDGGSNGDVLVINIYDKIIHHKYLYHILSSDEFFKYNMQHAKGAKMPRGNKQKIMEYIFPIPPIEEQERIVKLLDQFDATHTAIEEEITKEIKLRTQQYEYYREKLLSFPQN